VQVVQVSPDNGRLQLIYVVNGPADIKLVPAPGYQQCPISLLISALNALLMWQRFVGTSSNKFDTAPYRDVRVQRPKLE
jgi:hypothetical protein